MQDEVDDGGGDEGDGEGELEHVVPKVLSITIEIPLINRLNLI